MVQLRHDVTSCFSLRRTVRRWQCLIAIEDSDESSPGAGHSAFHRAHGAIADLGGFLISKTSRTNKDEGFALFSRKSLQCASDIGKLSRPTLIVAVAGHGVGVLCVPWDLTPSAPPLGIKLVAQYREQPGFQVRPRHK